MTDSFPIRSSTIRFGEFELDPVRGDLKRHGAPVEIQATPLRLLVYLVEHAGEVVSRDELLERVWSGVVVNENTIAAALKHLRLVLGDRERQTPWITTLRGRGVRFDPPVERATSGPLESEPGLGRDTLGTSRSHRIGWWLVRIALTTGLTIGLTIGLLMSTVWLSWPAPLGLALDFMGLGDRAASLPLPDRPSIAILPFENLSGDASQEYLADGLTEHLTTDLAQHASLFVVSRNSAFTYKGRTVDARDVGRELGVRFLLEGSVQHDGNRIRINAQLVDTTTGGHRWSERYDRELVDLFDLQTQLAGQIRRSLLSQIQWEEANEVGRRTTRSLAAYDEYMKGAVHMFSSRRESTTTHCRRHAESAIELDPTFSTAYSMLAYCTWAEWGLGWSRDRSLLDRAEELAEQATELDPYACDGLQVQTLLALNREQVDRALDLANRLVACRPNHIPGHIVRSSALAQKGRFLAAFRSLATVSRLDPRGALTSTTLAPIQMMAGRKEQARDLFETVRAGNPDLVLPRLTLVVWYEEEGEHSRARELVAEILRIVPEFDAEWGAALLWPGVAADPLALLRRAGLPARVAESMSRAEIKLRTNSQLMPSTHNEMDFVSDPEPDQTGPTGSPNAQEPAASE